MALAAHPLARALAARAVRGARALHARAPARAAPAAAGGGWGGGAGGAGGGERWEQERGRYGRPVGDGQRRGRGADYDSPGRGRGRGGRGGGRGRGRGRGRGPDTFADGGVSRGSSNRFNARARTEAEAEELDRQMQAHWAEAAERDRASHMRAQAREGQREHDGPRRSRFGAQPGRVTERHIEHILDEATGKELLWVWRGSRDSPRDAAQYIKEGDKVTGVVERLSPKGVNVVVDGSFEGLVFYDSPAREQQVEHLRMGAHISAYVRKVRADNRLDLAFQMWGKQGQANSADTLLARIEASGGFLPVNDKSSPDRIADLLGMSKASFKKAMGALLKRKRIVQTPDGIEAIDEGEGGAAPRR